MTAYNDVVVIEQSVLLLMPFGAMLISLLCQGCSVYCHMLGLPQLPSRYSLLGVEKRDFNLLPLKIMPCDIPIHCVFYLISA